MRGYEAGPQPLGGLVNFQFMLNPLVQPIRALTQNSGSVLDRAHSLWQVLNSILYPQPHKCLKVLLLGFQPVSCLFRNQHMPLGEKVVQVPFSESLVLQDLDPHDILLFCQLSSDSKQIFQNSVLFVDCSVWNCLVQDIQKNSDEKAQKWECIAGETP